MKGTTNIPVVGVIFRRGNEILFVLRQNTGWMDGHYALPGGHVDPGESFLAAACREAKEEVGIELHPNQLEHRITYHKSVEDKVVIGIYFEAINWEGEPRNAEPEKHSEIAWLDQDNLPENVIPTTKEKIKLLKDNVTYVEQGWQSL
jgi:8-oxo-dGTP diphosphatase